MMQNVADIYPLSPLQEEMLSNTLDASKPGFHVAQMSFGVEGNLDVALLKRAWQKIQERHSVLRTTFVWERVEKPLQIVRKEAALPWDEHDWRHLSNEQQEQQLLHYLQEERQRGFNLAKAPLMRLALLRLGNQRYQLIWSCSRLCLDSRSLEIVLQDVLAHYRALAEGRDLDIPAPLPFREFIAWVQKQNKTQAESFWRKALKGVQSAGLVVAETPAQKKDGKKQALNISGRLDRAITAKLQAEAERHGLKLDTLVAGAWAWLLGRYNQSADVVLGVSLPVRSPMSKGADSIAGVLQNTLPLRVTIDGSRQLVAWLKTIQEDLAEVQKYGFSSLAQIKRWSEVLATEPLFTTVLVLQDHPFGAEVEVVNGFRFVSRHQFSGLPYPVTLWAEEQDGLFLRLEFDGNRFNCEGIARIMSYYKNMLWQMAIRSERKLDEFSLVSAAEEAQLLLEWDRVQSQVLVEQKSRVDRQAGGIEIPENRIPPECDAIRPEMLPLVELSQEEIERIVRVVPGGARNVQDIYALTPLQEGILFHHRTAEKGDPYVMARVVTFANRKYLDVTAKALQAVVDRHDILRTGVVWEGLREPVQVVWRNAVLPLQEVVLDGESGDVAEQLYEQYGPQYYRLDMTQAPLLRLVIAEDKPQRRWLMLILMHHLAGDHRTLDMMGGEVEAHLLGRAGQLPKPQPFRDLVAQARLGMSQEEHEAFFREMLGDVEEPTLPFGLVNVQGDGTGIKEAWRTIRGRLAQRIREQARKLGVSAASVCYVGWAQMLAKASGTENVVFGTIVFGRMGGGEGAEHGLGLFMNTLPMRVQLERMVAEASVRQTHKVLAELLRHEHASLALAQKCSGVSAPKPLFSALLNYRNARAVEAAPGEGRLAWKELHFGKEDRTNYPLVLTLDFGEEIGLWAQAVAPVDPERVCGYMVRTLESLVDVLEREPQREMWEVDVLPEEERRQVLLEWNQTSADYGLDKCIHELFEQQAEKLPEATAILFENLELSYRELNHEANKVARDLQARGVRPEVLVGICMEPSLDMAAALLGILKAGGAYVPLDPEHPQERLRWMVEDAGINIVLTQENLKEMVSGFGIREVLPVRVMKDEGTEFGKLNPVSRVQSENLAYVIYTSGATGKPKGAMNTHGAIRNRLLWMQDAYRLQARERVLQRTPLSSDVSLWEFFWPLIQGGCLVLARPGEHQNGEYLVRLIEDEGINTVHFTPSSLATFLQTAEAGSCGRLRRVICSGESLPAGLAEEFLDRFGAELHNVYGPAEAAADATYWKGEKGYPGTTVPIGRPIANLQIYILDREMQPVPVGVAGELYIGGVGVGRGYWKRPDLTAECFLPDPFVAKVEKRMYRTGDLARWREDGVIEFLGRNDFQIKIRGYRIEPGEIEARLLTHESVKEAVVIAREDTPGNKRLVAYYTLKEGHAKAEVGAAVLQAHLAIEMPQYMVPAAYVLLENLPLTPSGKLDRQRLSAPEKAVYAARGYEAPMGEAERALAEIWREVLKVERVGRQDNFFELGGDSLLAMRVMERMGQQGFQADLLALLTAPTLAELAVATGGSNKAISIPENRIPAGCEHITPAMLPLLELSQVEIEKIVATVPGGTVNVQDIYPLATLQEGILFHHLMGDEGDPYLSVSLLGFDSRKRLDSYLRAMQIVVDRHDILRTAMVWDGLPEPVQVVWRKAMLPVEEVLPRGTGDLEKELLERYNPLRYRINVQQAPLWRIYIAKDEQKNRWLMLMLLHHLVADQRAVTVLEEEIEAHVLGQAAQLPEPQPFRNLVAQARLGISKEEHERFFREMLGDVDEPTLPFGLVDVQADWDKSDTVYVILGDGLAARIQAGAQKLGVSAATVFHAAWSRVLAVVSGREDVVFGTVLVGRMGGGEAAKRGVGLFINTLPIRLQVGDQEVGASVRETHRRLAELVVHEHASLALAQKCSGVPAPTPPFSALLNFRSGLVNRAQARRRTEGVETLKWEERTNYPLTLLVDFGEEIGLLSQTAPTVDPRRVCGYMKRALESLLEAVASGDGRAIRTLEVLPAAERQQVLLGWNRTKLEYRNGSCVHEVFEEQVAKTPDKVAVEFEDQQLTYGELNRRANQLARYLRKIGVQREARAILSVERCLEFVVGVLAVWKAGGAYVPLDPGYPAERLSFMLEDSAPVVILTQAHLQSKLSEISGSVPILDINDSHRWQDHSETNLDCAGVGLTARHLAYVIYTSGSTGKPKGVMIEHRGVCNQIAGFHAQIQTCANDRVLQFTAFIFDPSVEETFSALLAGATLIIRSDAWLAGAQQFWGLVRDRGITLMDLPTRFWGQIEQDATAEIPWNVRQVMIGGEAVERKALVSWFERKGYRPPLWNSYGPTEVTVNATLHAIDSNPGSWNSIGGPMANVQLYVLDANLEPAPSGVVGELYIAGDGLARGYWNRPELTAERFPADPFAEEAGARMYKSGDLVKWLEDGTVAFVGRNDFQVKIRGFRIELEEIETRLAHHPGVRTAVVIAREDGPGGKRLVAYYTVKEGYSQEEIGADVLRAYLAGQLPDYMVPAAYVWLEKMPLILHGKLDRKALPAPDREAYAGGYEQPVGAIEKTLAGIWAQVLQVEKVGRHDNFFELGGHSLLATQVVSRTKAAFQVEIPLRRLFETSTMAEFAKIIEQLKAENLPEEEMPKESLTIKRAARHAVKLPAAAKSVRQDSVVS